MKIIKKNGTEQEFDFEKLKNAIKKANNSVDEKEKILDEDLEKISGTIEKMLKGFSNVNADDLNDIIEKALMKHNKYSVAKAFIIFRDEKKKNKKFNNIEEQAIALVEGTNESLRGDNANKHIDVASSQRDYLAGLVCKSYFEKTAPKDLVKAHRQKWVHFHDTDYSPLMPLWNCDLLNIEDMLNNGFQMGDTHIDSPKTFSIAANLLAQISLIVSGSQYGGQTISWAHLIPFIEKTRNYYNALYDKAFDKIFLGKFFKFLLKPIRKNIIEILTDINITTGVKTYQYQIVCHHSSNGQTPFVSNVLNLREAYPSEQKDFAKLIEKILKRRIKGVKDSHGFWVGPLFPKLLYWTCDGLNVKKGDPYFYLTELAAKCNSVRCQPDINSEKITREIKKGQMIPSMGCRSSLSPLWEEEKVSEKDYFHYQTISKNAKKFEGAPGTNYDFSKQEIYGPLPISNLDKFVINFRGNSAWIKDYDSETKTWTILKPKVYGRFNSGVVTVNLPHAALSAVQKFKEQQEAVGTATEMNVEVAKKTLMEIFYETLTDYLQICRKGLIYRTNRVKQIKAKNVPIHLQYGAIARMSENETVGDWVAKHPKAMSTSFGFIGLFETCQALIGESNTTKKGQKLCIEILNFINEKISEWSEEDELNYSLYGTPEESLTYAAALALRRDFGFIDKITDKDYVVNSYHVDPRQEIAWDEKLKIESKYLNLSSGGAISYIETPDMQNNPEALVKVIQFMHENITYAEINRKMGVCYKCGCQGDFKLNKTENGKFEFECPSCGNKDDRQMNVQGRLCGYLGQISSSNTNHGRLDDIFHRVIHFN